MNLYYECPNCKQVMSLKSASSQMSSGYILVLSQCINSDCNAWIINYTFTEDFIRATNIVYSVTPRFLKAFPKIMVKEEEKVEEEVACFCSNCKARLEYDSMYPVDFVIRRDKNISLLNILDQCSECEAVLTTSLSHSRVCSPQHVNVFNKSLLMF